MTAPTRRVTTLLLDADDTLFPSEGPAFTASAAVTRAMADRYRLPGDFSAEQLRRASTGSNFRAAAVSLLTGHGIEPDAVELDGWVARERDAVTAHLARVLRPVPEVRAAVAALARGYRLAVVSSSALVRVAACLSACGLDDLLPEPVRFSAEDSLPVPGSKPDPAVYRLALRRLGTDATAALAVEDSPAGARSALAAGISTNGLLHFVPPGERARRAAALRDAGVGRVLDSWANLVGQLTGERA